MKTKTKLILTAFSSVMVGLVIGGFVTFYFTTLFFMDGFYTNQIGRSAINISTLVHLREGNIDKSIKMLEIDLDASEITLREPYANVSETTKASIKESLSHIDRYKRKYNVK